MADIDNVSKPKTDADPTSSNRTGDGQKYTPDLASGKIPNPRRSLQTPQQLLMLQRVIGNRATQKFIQRDVEKIDDIPGEMSKWPQDFDGLVGKYAPAQAIKDIYGKNPPGHLLEKLRQVVVLYENAAKITAVLQKAPDEKRIDWVNKIQDSKGQLGLSEGTLFQDDDAQMMAVSPEYATDFFQRVLGKTIEKWGSLDKEGKEDFAEQIFNQPKGYDWAVIDVEKWKPPSERRADFANLVKKALTEPSNNEPFTLKSLHIEHVGEYIKTKYEKNKKMEEPIAELLMAKIGNTLGYKGINALVVDNEEAVLEALKPYLEDSAAKLVFAALVDVTDGY